MALIDDLWAYYSFEETSGTTCNDIHSTHDGTIDGATVNVTGKIGQAYDFDGSNDEVYLSEMWQKTGASDFSISVWVNFDTVSSAQAIVSQWASNSATKIYLALTSSGKIQFLLDNASTSDPSIDSTTTLSTNTWYHVVATYNGTSKAMKLYINGVYEATTTGTFGTGNFYSNQNLLFGNFRDSGGNWLNGNIEELALFDKTLSDDGVSLTETAGGEIAELYNSGSGLSYPLTSNVTVSPTALTLSLTDEAPQIYLNGSWGTPQALTLSLHSPTLLNTTIPILTTREIGTGQLGTRFVNKDWYDGTYELEAYKQGKQINLVPTGSSRVLKKDRTGL